MDKILCDLIPLKTNFECQACFFYKGKFYCEKHLPEDLKTLYPIARVNGINILCSIDCYIKRLRENEMDKKIMEWKKNRIG